MPSRGTPELLTERPPAHFDRYIRPQRSAFLDPALADIALTGIDHSETNVDLQRFPVNRRLLKALR